MPSVLITGHTRRALLVVSQLALCLLLAASPARLAAASEPTPLDLEGAIARALEHNLTLSLRALGPEGARLAVDGAEAAFALRLTPELAAERLDDGTATAYGARAERRFQHGTVVSARALRAEAPGAFPAQEIWSVEVSQPLLRRFGALVHREPVLAAHRALEAAERGLAEQQADLVLDVVATYEAILRLRRQVEADEKAVERTELLARTTGAQERLGRATRIDTLRVSLQLGQLETRLQGSLEQLELTHQDLAVLLGAAPGTRFELASTPGLELELPPLEEALEIAFAHRLDYAQALADAQDAERRSRIARRELLPDLAASLRYDHREGLGPGIDGGALFVGMRVSRDLFERDAQVAVSRSLLDQSADRRRVEIVEQLVARDVQRSWLAFRRARAEVPLLRRNLEHAETRLELAARLFSSGRGDNFTVVDAEESFVRAQSQLLDGLAAVAVDGYRLLRSLGTLVEAPEHLRPRAARPGAASAGLDREEAAP